MIRPATPLRLLLLLSPLLLIGCGNGNGNGDVVRPALVERPVPAGASVEAFPGDVRARHEAVLSFRVGGKIARRQVDAGARVQEGQVLAELDPEDLQLQVAAVRAQLAAAQANLANARSERDRYRSMFERKLVSRSLYEAQENAYQAAEAQVGQVQAQLDVSRNQAGYAALRAPQDGAIAVRHAEAGQVVAAGQPVFTLAAEGEREIAISLPERDIQRFAVGQTVLVELWSRQGQRLPGTIRELAPAADPQTRTFAARVSFDADASGADLGQSARVYVGEHDSGALAVPLSAVTAEDGQAYVWVVDPQTSQVRRSAVQIGPYGETHVPVLSGVSEQSWVVVAGVHLLREGQTVRAVDRSNRSVSLATAD